jgi:alpha-galactosidase
MINREPNKYGYLADASNPVNGYPGWQTRSDVWVSYWGESNAENRRGNLDADFGDYGAQGRIGPEYGFGLVAGSQLADQVLLIKYAFGGKSLISDFRPPSSGGTTGAYYTGMVARVHQVLDNLKSFFPAYNNSGYELVGLGWHQGWNDLGEETAVYETNLTNLIKDLRTEFQAPNLRVSIGVTGMANANASSNSLKLIAAQMNVANPTLHPEFAGTVASVDTRPFDYGTLLGSSDEGYHWNWSAESYYNIGDSMGKAMMSILPSLSPANQMLTFGMPNQTQATISGTNITLTVASDTNLATLSPEFTLSPNATATPVSGSMRDFTTPQTYTITAQNGAVQTYTVTATLSRSYSIWASAKSQGLSRGINDGLMDDPDHDGIPNLTEFALTGAPMTSSLSILPQMARSGDNWFFNYDRNPLSSPPATSQVVEYGSDLIGWTPITIPATSNDQVTITPTSTLDHVSVKIPNAGNRSFARLKITP